MMSQDHQALLAEHGLTEDEDGSFGLTPRGLRRGLRRAYELRGQGSAECAEILALDGDDERRAQLALHLQAEAFSEAYSKNSWSKYGG
jgi:hypothetical protein